MGDDKTFRILVISNRLAPGVTIADDLGKVKKYEETHTPLKIDFGFEETDLDLTHKSFGVKKMVGGVMQEMYGLDSVKEKVRALGIVPRYFFHAVVFVYGLEDTGWFEDHAPKGHQLGHWTYFKELYPGTEFIEIATSEGWDAIGDVYRVLTHELRHAYFNRARRNGVNLRDPMDATPVNGEIIPYYKEFDVEAEDGNRAIANNILHQFWDKVTWHAGPYLLKVLLKQSWEALSAAWELIMTYYRGKGKVEAQKSRIEEWAAAIKEFEGWFVGSRSYRNNNPGNLRWSKYQMDTDGGFSVFKDYETGWKALIFQLTIAVDGRSKVYKPEDTLHEFFAKYAPSVDNNHPETYAKFVAQKLGVTINTQIKELL